MDEISIEDELINEAKEFYNNNKKQIGKNLRLGTKALIIDFNELSKYSISLADAIIERPEETIQLLEIAAEDTEWIPDNIRVRFASMSSTQEIHIRNIRAKHLGNMISIDGVIRRASEVRPQVTNMKFECPSCGSIVSILQIEKEQKTPSRCSCGRKGSFKEIAKDMVDSQVVVIEESPDALEDGGDQPKRIKVFLKEDLTDEHCSKKIIPGNKVKIIGVLKEIEQGSGRKLSTVYDIAIDANNVIMLNEDSLEIDISEEDEREILEISKRDDLFEFLGRSVAPSVYGNEEIKQALTLQLFSGVSKKRSDGNMTREQIHGLLVGDPGCCRKDTYITMSDGTFKQIGDFGSVHEEDIDENIMMDDNSIENANMFWKFNNYATKKIKLSNGKKLICSLIHPLLVKRNNKVEWVKAKNLRNGDMVKIVNYVKSSKTDYVKHIGKDVNEEMGFIWGAMIGDGYTKSDGYRIGFTATDKKSEVINLLQYYLKNNFNKKFNIRRINPTESKIGDRIIKQKYIKNDCVINSKELCSFFKMEKSKYKRIPKCIMASKDSVISNFLNGLFSTDGSCYVSNQKNRTQKININFKSSSEWLLQDVQLLLTRFGIQSRIYKNGLTIRRYNDILLFRKYIGFTNYNKSKLLNNAEKYKPSRTTNVTDFEKIVSITDNKIQDVYDITVPATHKYISNGIVSHNTAKSVILKYLQEISNKARYVSGKSASGVGLTASATKDDMSGAWVLEAGAMVLANRGSLFIDEFEKMSEEDRSNLHEAMSIGTISVSKASIQSTLNAKTSILAAANPKFGRFEPDRPLASQINLAPSLLSRFDFIFVMRDVPEELRDTMIADKIFEEHADDDDIPDILTKDMFKKYVAYAKRLKPKLGEAAIKVLKDYYIGIRNRTKVIDGKIVIPIGARQLEGLIRFSEASAKARLSRMVTIADATHAIKIMETYLKEVGYDEENQIFDIDKVGGSSAKQRKKIDIVKDAIRILGKESNGLVEINKLKKSLDSNCTGDDVDDSLEKLVRCGDLFRPKRGFVKLM